MTMTISLATAHEDNRIDIIIEEEQIISHALHVLEESGRLKAIENKTIRSTRSGQRIHIESTFAQEHIYNGDILYIE